MPYAYRCDVCKTTSPAVPDRATYAQERQRHRDRFHGGHVPDGEKEIVSGHHLPSGLLLRVGVALFVLWGIFSLVQHL